MSHVTCAAEGCDRLREQRDWCRPHYFRWCQYGDPLAGPALRMSRRGDAECSVEGCTAVAVARTWRRLHYERWRKHGDVQALKVTMGPPRAEMCSIEGCAKAVRARTWCSMHYQRWRIHGDPRTCLFPEVTNACGIDECQRPVHKSGVCYRHHREFTKLFMVQQEGCCAICKISLATAVRSLVLDHCHKTGRPRGLLCHHCNCGIGFMQDDARLLLAAVDYLQSTG